MRKYSTERARAKEFGGIRRGVGESGLFDRFPLLVRGSCRVQGADEGQEHLARTGGRAPVERGQQAVGGCR